MMTKILLAAGAAALVFAAPASADPGHGKGHGNKGKAKHGQVYQGRVAYDRWGIDCPPGLAKRNNGCLPPGIAKKRYNIGQRWDGRYGYQWNYGQVPYDWREQYNLDPSNRYYYRDGYLYSVDPRTRLVEAIVQALIR